MPALPLFPLTTVLFPGVLLPLTVFEERYRDLMRELLDHADGPRRFGVIAIRQGWEVGPDALRALHPVGCAAELRKVSRYPDGRYDVVTIGTDRFRLTEVDADSHSYLTGTVEWLPAGPAADGDLGPLSASVSQLFTEYVAAAAAAQGVTVDHLELPTEPGPLSFQVASAAALTLDDRQALLEADDARSRLRAELRLLKREITMLRRLRALPVPVAELQVTQSLS